MKIHFFVPPAPQRVGGLDGAIEGLRDALAATGAEVSIDSPALPEPGSVVHFHGLWQWRFQALARHCRAHGIPYFVSPHGMLEPWALEHKGWKKRPYFHLFEKRLLQHARAVLATAEMEAARLRTLLPGTRVETVPLGLTGSATPDYEAARAELGWPAGDRVLLFLSRIHPKKGLDLLLRALAEQPLPPGSPARLVIVGEGDPAYVSALQRWAAEHAESLPRLDWVGPVWGEKRWRYYQGADLFCLPTHSENFGLVVLEAWQCGTPVLTTTGTPWAALLENRGYLSEPTVPSLLCALRQAGQAALSTHTQRKALSAWAYENFAWDRLAPAYRALYA